MLRSLLWRMLSILILSSNPGHLVAQPSTFDGGRVVELEVPAPALKGNLLDTPSIQRAAIYLPPSYDQEPDRSFPVLYLLHGIFDEYDVWIEHFEVPKILDRLIENENLPELIVVMPNAGNVYGGGYYRNSPASGNWADYIADDLVEFVDAQFRTLKHAESRAVVGHSMGGYGALNLAMSKSGVFSVVWALSPCCLAPIEDLGFGNQAWRRAFAVTEPGDLRDLVDGRDFYTLAILGIVTAFSPDRNAPPTYGSFPFDIVRGEVVLDDAAFDQFRDAFPVRQVRDARDSLRDLRGLGLGVGLGDQFSHIPAGTLEFSQLLGSERIPHRLDFYVGDHRQEVGERLETIVFPWVVERLIAK